MTKAMTVQEAREHFALRPEDTINVASTKSFLENRKRALTKCCYEGTRIEIKKDIEAIEVLLREEGDYDSN